MSIERREEQIRNKSGQSCRRCCLNASLYGRHEDYTWWWTRLWWIVTFNTCCCCRFERSPTRSKKLLHKCTVPTIFYEIKIIVSYQKVDFCFHFLLEKGCRVCTLLASLYVSRTLVDGSYNYIHSIIRPSGWLSVIRRISVPTLFWFLC